ncbi:Arm DNA-binding domain-containing protein [Mucilaginibacter frigoritolerans]
MACNYLIISVMISAFCLNFALKKTKILANGTAPIYLRLTIEGDRIEFTTRRYVNPSRWNATTQKMTGTSEEARSFNLYLKTLGQQVYYAHRQRLAPEYLHWLRRNVHH